MNLKSAETQKMMFERDFSFLNSPMTHRYDSPFGFIPRNSRQDDPFRNFQQRRRVPRQECQCGNCQLSQGSANQQANRGGRGRTTLDEDHIEIPINITKTSPKNAKSGPAKPKIILDSAQRPKNNRPKKSGGRNPTKVEKETIITSSGAKEQPQKLNVGNRSNLAKEEPILVQLSTPEIKKIDFDPFQADEEIEIPPCL